MGGGVAEIQLASKSGLPPREERRRGGLRGRRAARELQPGDRRRLEQGLHQQLYRRRLPRRCPGQRDEPQCRRVLSRQLQPGPRAWRCRHRLADPGRGAHGRLHGEVLRPQVAAEQDDRVPAGRHLHRGRHRRRRVPDRPSHRARRRRCLSHARFRGRLGDLRLRGQCHHHPDARQPAQEVVPDRRLLRSQLHVEPGLDCAQFGGHLDQRGVWQSGDGGATLPRATDSPAYRRRSRRTQGFGGSTAVEAFSTS
jgi:hypothetical protein